jgi:hypothetical protein
MFVIFKYPLALIRHQSISLPIFARILTVQFQGDQLCLWAAVDTSLSSVPVQVYIYGTGHEISERDLQAQYVSTVQGGGFVWHVFTKR